MFPTYLPISYLTHPFKSVCVCGGGGGGSSEDFLRGLEESNSKFIYPMRLDMTSDRKGGGGVSNLKLSSVPPPAPSTLLNGTALRHFGQSSDDSDENSSDDACSVRKVSWKSLGKIFIFMHETFRMVAE